MGIGYGALFFLARRPVALRLGTVGWGAATLLALRLGLTAAGRPLETAPDQALTVTLLLLAAGSSTGRRAWLVRATIDELCDQVQAAARGLRLTCEEVEEGRLRLTEKARVEHLSVRELAPHVQLVLLPRMTAAGKTALLVRWLSKQYAGPVPRVRVVLEGGRDANENANGPVHRSH